MSAAFRDFVLANNGQSATSANIVFTGTGAAQVGDLAIVLIDVNSTTATVSSVPTDWLLNRGLDVAAGTFEMAIYTKILTAGDIGGTATWTMNSSLKCIGLMVIVSNEDQSTPLEPITLATSGSTNVVITAPAITTHYVNEFIIEFFVGHTPLLTNALATLSGELTEIGYCSTNFTGAPNLSVQVAYVTAGAPTPGIYGSGTATYVNTNPQQGSYTLAVRDTENSTPGNIGHWVRSGNMSRSEVAN